MAPRRRHRRATTEPALWPLAQEYTGPDGKRRTRRGFLARVRVTEYGAGRIRPHERTHPGPKEDRLRLTRATKTNLSPIFSLFSDPSGAAWSALEPLTEAPPWAETTDDDGTVNRLWRVEDPAAIEAVKRTVAPAELLIADGHHRYETARVYADEVGGEGPQRFVLMCLVALQDPGLTVFPTHRLVRGLRRDQHEALAQALRRDFEVEPLADTSDLVPLPGRPSEDRLHRRPLQAAVHADAEGPEDRRRGARGPRRALPAARYGRARGADPQGRAGDDRRRHRPPLRPRDTRGTRTRRSRLVQSGEYDAAFFMAPTPIEQVREVAAAGESMPPKSTYFFPKVPTGLVFNPLVE